MCLLYIYFNNLRLFGKNKLMHASVQILKVDINVFPCRYGYTWCMHEGITGVGAAQNIEQRNNIDNNE